MHPAALRWQELCMGFDKEQENQCCNAKPNGREPVRKYQK